MKSSKLAYKPLILGILAVFLMGHDAQAYIDPNAAGLLYQIFFPLIVAVTLAWRWIKEFVRQVWCKLTGRVN